MQLRSSGGQNRFLGVYPSGGGVYSVGWAEETLVEWRPFVFENVARLVPDGVFALHIAGQTQECPASEAAGAAVRWLGAAGRDDAGRFSADADVVVPRAAVLSLIVAIARELSALHRRGLVHGDLKPHNVLLPAGGVMLIDGFDVEVGATAPGWTPDWSAPEQVLGLPLSPAADVYPLARMVAEALDAQLVGELRHYQTPRAAGFRRYEMIHDPSLFIDGSSTTMGAAAKRAWRELVEGALRFDPSAREPATADEFARKLEELAGEHPVGGSLRFRPSGALMAARLVDGTDAVCRAVPAGPVGTGFAQPPPPFQPPPPERPYLQPPAGGSTRNI